MTQQDFLAVLEEDLRLRGDPFARDELQAWVAKMWPLIREGPDAVRWAGEFLDRNEFDRPTIVD
jgi:hypothetical protein